MPEQADLANDFNDFLETSLCGYVTASPDGIISEVNSRFCQWVGYDKKYIIGKKFSDFLSIGGKIYFETHLAPLLRMQHYFDEIALELCNREGQKLPVLVNGYE